MSRALQSLPDFLAPLVRDVPQAARVAKYPFAAVGSIAAEEILSPRALPEKATALRAGFAIAAADTVGASPHAPVLLPGYPQRVAVDTPLPGGCDAVIDEGLLKSTGIAAEISEQVAPGQDVRFAGHDLADHFVLVRRGDKITAAMALACASAGIGRIDIFAPTFSIASHDSPARGWLMAQLAAQGCFIVNNGEDADLAIVWDESAPPHLALSPGMAIAANRGAGGFSIVCAPRFDSVVALYGAILLPVVAAMTARIEHRESAPLMRKVTSAIGMSEIVLLAQDRNGVTPLGAGVITLEALLQSDALAILPPSSEGLAAGAMIDYMRFAGPLVRSDIA